MGTVRVVSGLAGGRRLAVPRADGVRPTLQRTREALFSILGEGVAGGTVLDLFAGSGALGIEALSRGARHVVFVDENPRCVACVRENLHHCGFRTGHRIVRGRLPDVLQTLRAALPRPADLVLMDPPYGWTRRDALFESLDRCSLLKDHARIVCEHFHKDVFPRAPSRFLLEKQRRYGDTVISFFLYLPGDPLHAP